MNNSTFQAQGDNARERFLNAAEYLFGEYGYDGVKIRTIADLSKVNLATLHHYWGNKENLFADVCKRRLEPMNAERLKRFEALTEKSGDAPVNIRALFRASLEPTFFLDELAAEERSIFSRFYGRALSDPSPVVGKVMRNIFTPVSTRFFELLRPSCPHLTDDEFYWRSMCIFGAYMYAPAFSDRMKYYAHADFDTTDSKTGVEEIITFLTAGMLAPGANL